jgi:hypothetical protein
MRNSNSPEERATRSEDHLLNWVEACHAELLSILEQHQRREALRKEFVRQFMWAARNEDQDNPYVRVRDLWFRSWCREHGYDS